MPSLSAFIEVYYGEAPNWLPTIPDNTPEFVRLNGNVSDSDIELVLYTASIFNAATSNEPYIQLEKFLPDNVVAAPGGLVARDGEISIYPSCCCGIETWREWLGLLSGAESPWLGHEPSPFVEATTEGFRVWPDGGLGEVRPEIKTSILFTREQLTLELISIEADLNAFIGKLLTWGEKNHPKNATAIVGAMRNLLALNTQAAG